MTFQESVTTCFQKYAVFTGRATRSEYWWFILLVMVVYLVTLMIHPMLALVANLGLLLPQLGAGVRRLHDIGKSGWWLLIGLIPLVGLYLLYLMVQPTDPEANEYGEAPVL